MQHGNYWLLASALLAAATAVAAQAGSDRGRDMMSWADTNDDGAVTLTEMRDHRKQRFRAADMNGDGVLDVEEIREAMAEQRARRRLERMDRDGDGAVSTEEFTYPVERRLMIMDRNGDGRVERGEMRYGSDDEEWMRGYDDREDDERHDD